MPIAQIDSRLLDGLETNVLTKLRVDDPLLQHCFGVQEALFNVVIDLGEAPLEEVLLLGQLLLDNGLLDGEFLDLVEQQLRVRVHSVRGGGVLLDSPSVVVMNRGFGWKWWWRWGWWRIQIAEFLNRSQDRGITGSLRRPAIVVRHVRNLDPVVCQSKEKFAI